MRWVFTLLFTFAKVGLVLTQNFSVVLNEGDSIGSNIAEIYLHDNTLYYPSISIDGNSRVYEYNLTSGEASKNLYYERDVFRKVVLEDGTYLTFGISLEDSTRNRRVALTKYTEADSLIKKILFFNNTYPSYWPFDIEKIGDKIFVSFLLERFEPSGAKDRDIGIKIFDKDLNLLNDDILNNHIELSYVWNMTQTHDHHLIMSIGAHFYNRWGSYAQVIKMDTFGNEVWRWNGNLKLLHGAVNVQSATLSNDVIAIGYRRDNLIRDSTFQNGFAGEVNSIVFINEEGDSIGEKNIYIPFGENHVVTNIRKGNGPYFFSCGYADRDVEGVRLRFANIIKHDLEGDTIWARQFRHPTIGGGNNYTEIFDIVELENGSIAGVAWVDNLENIEVLHNWAFSLDSNGCFDEGCEGDVFVSNQRVGTFSDKDLYIYPNPVTDELRIRLSVEEISSVIVYNITGNQVLEGKNTNRVDVTALSKGIYFLCVQTQDGSWRSQKFVKYE